jgi:hypothetical protein
MDSTPQLLSDRPAFFPRVTTRDGRAIEEAMAGDSLLGEGARLDGAVIEASYAPAAMRL